jgi:hypothetical protein
MIVRKVSKGDGSYNFELGATEEEVGYLINIALECLVSIGAISLRESESEEIDLSQIPMEEFHIV